MPSAILTSVADSIATLTLNKPQKMNAWDSPMRGEVMAALKAFNADAGVRAVIVTGSGDRAFSAGQDLEETEKFQTGQAGADWFASWRTFYDTLRNLDKPVVAALNGVAAGSAYQFSLLTDLRVGHRGVRMGQPEINSGIPSVTGPMLMLPRIGLSRTIELTLTGRMMDAAECAAIGLIQHLVDTPDQVMPKAREIAALLASKPPIAMRLNKKRFRQITQADYDEAFANGGDYQAAAYASGEPQAAMRAFFAARAKKK
ncbi:MAG: enoyl-CoA hydratase/isomerase family protein [Alphaproteobacteria bacterium]|nr:enoyl-CoA hydratase/isomerase family protein [Alphaproteobacteria bacterium]